MNDPRWQKMLDWRDEEESKLSPTSKALPRPPAPDRQLRKFRKALEEDDAREMEKDLETLTNIQSIQSQLAPDPGNLLGNLDKITTDFAATSVANKQKENREKMLREKMEREKIEREKATMAAFEKMYKVDEEYRDLISGEEYLESTKPEATLEKNRRMLEELEEYKQSQLKEYENIRNSDKSDDIKELEMEKVLKNAESTQEQINLIMSLNEDLELIDRFNKLKYTGGRSAPLKRNKRTKVKTRKALSRNDKPRYDQSTLHPVPRQNESIQQFNRRMRRRRTTRTMPRRINRIIAERDLGDYPDEPGMFGGTRRANSATYKRTKNKNRKKSIKSMGSNPQLNLKEREQYMPRKNDNRKKFMMRLARRRNSRRLIGNDRRNNNTEIYNENRPLYDAKKRLSKSKSYLNKNTNRKPQRLSDLPDDLLEKIYEM